VGRQHLNIQKPLVGLAFYNLYYNFFVIFFLVFCSLALFSCWGANKIFCTYLLPCFLLEHTKKIVFQTFNLLLAFQNKQKN